MKYTFVLTRLADVTIKPLGVIQRNGVINVEKINIIDIRIE